ncbi:MAG: preprotein translocase subunit SecA, partial [Verrucomicrobiales bacterium]
EAIANEAAKLHETGRPILVGTRNVANSELLATLLDQRGLNYRLLNAVRHQEEAQIIADAGQRGRITSATNMAGRGTDIKLGPSVAEVGGLHVIATERHESGRVDRQLFGRSARQGDPGSAQAFVSIDDELLRRYLHPAIYKQVRAVVKGSLPGKQMITEGAFKMAQNNAQRLAYRQRASVLRTDDWLDEALSFAGPGIA